MLRYHPLVGSVLLEGVCWVCLHVSRHCQGSERCLLFTHKHWLWRPLLVLGNAVGSQRTCSDFALAVRGGET